MREGLDEAEFREARESVQALMNDLHEIGIEFACRCCGGEGHWEGE